MWTQSSFLLGPALLGSRLYQSVKTSPWPFDTHLNWPSLLMSLAPIHIKSKFSSILRNQGNTNYEMSQQTECGRSWGQTRDYKIGIYCFSTAQATIKRNSQRVGLVQQEVIIISSRVTCSRHDIAEILRFLALSNNHSLSKYGHSTSDTDTVHQILTLISIKKTGPVT